MNCMWMDGEKNLTNKEKYFYSWTSGPPSPQKVFFKIFEERRPIINETNELYVDGWREESNK